MHCSSVGAIFEHILRWRLKNWSAAVYTSPLFLKKGGKLFNKIGFLGRITWVFEHILGWRRLKKRGEFCRMIFPLLIIVQQLLIFFSKIENFTMDKIWIYFKIIPKICPRKTPQKSEEKFFLQKCWF